MGRTRIGDCRASGDEQQQKLPQAGWEASRVPFLARVSLQSGTRRHLQAVRRVLTHHWLHLRGRGNLLSRVLPLWEVDVVPWAPELQDGSIIGLGSLHLLIIVANVLHLYMYKASHSVLARAKRQGQGSNISQHTIGKIAEATPWSDAPSTQCELEMWRE